MPQNPDQGSETLVGDALMQADDATFAAELGLDIGTEAADTEDAQPRDDKGRFAARDQAEQAAAEDEVIAEAATETEEPAPEPAEGEAPEEPEPEPEKPKPLAPFTVRTPEGEEAEVPDIRLSFKAGGKEHQDVPLDKVVRWAQSGFHVEQVTQEAAELKQRLPQYEQQLNDRALELSDQRALNERLLTDPEFYQRAADQFARSNTPEQVLARREAALRQQQEEFESQRLQQEAGAFLQNVTLPRVQALHEQYPTVTEKEIVGALMIELAPLQRNGRVPREQWNEAVRLLEGPITEYVAAQHNMRDGVRATAETTAKQQVTKAQEEATKAKRQLARAIAPASSKTAPPKARTATTAEEAADAVTEEVLAAIMGG